MLLAKLVQYFLKSNLLESLDGLDVDAPIVQKPTGRGQFGAQFSSAAQNIFTTLQDILTVLECTKKVNL